MIPPDPIPINAEIMDMSDNGLEGEDRAIPAALDRSAAPSGLSQSSLSQAEPAATIAAPKSIADILDDAATLIEPEGAWTQCSYARDAVGASLGDGRDPDACCWCLVGALEKASGKLVGNNLTAPLYHALGWRSFSVVTWNDSEERKQVEVVSLLRNGAALAREQGK